MFKVTHFVLFNDVRGCSSEASFQTAISKRLEPHPASIETGGLQAIMLYFHIYAALDFIVFLIFYFLYFGSWETKKRYKNDLGQHHQRNLCT